MLKTILKLKALLAITTAIAFAAGEVMVIYVSCGDAAKDAASIADLQSEFTDTSTTSYSFSTVSSIGDANNLASYARNEAGDESMMIMHGVTDNDPSVDLVKTTNDGFVDIGNYTIQSNEVYYCYKDGGPEMSSGDMHSDWVREYGE